MQKRLPWTMGKKLWGAPPGPQPFPSSKRAFQATRDLLCVQEEADEGVGRGPGGPPHLARATQRAMGVSLLLCGLAFAQNGPLRILKSNPRYFTDNSGKAIYLTGTHNWNNFQDTGHRAAEGDPPPVLDYKWFLDFLESHHHNFFRLWRWEAPMWHDDEPIGIKHSSPHPWLRTGPGVAMDEKLRFDLTRFNPEYFDRMRHHIEAAKARGMYVSVMLFEGWEMQFVDAWTYHPYNPGNNVNQIDADINHDGRALEYFTLQPNPMGKRVLEFQEAYVRNVIDTVNDLDNVLYEICNEAGAFATDWQYHMVRLVHEYESRKPKQHPVGMTFEYPGGTNRQLFNSPADWISPNRGDPADSYLDNPPANFTGKVIVNDTDHLCGHVCGDNVWVWKSFTRGLHVLFMEELTPSPTWHDAARVGMGQTRQFSEKINLAEMSPHDELASTQYCLAKPGSEYVVFQPGGRGQPERRKRLVRRGVVRRKRRQDRARQACGGWKSPDFRDSVSGPCGSPSQECERQKMIRQAKCLPHHLLQAIVLWGWGRHLACLFRRQGDGQLGHLATRYGGPSRSRLTYSPGTWSTDWTAYRATAPSAKRTPDAP